MSTFLPYYSLISDISNAQRAVVTFTDDHSFVDGEYISFRVSPPYGMTQINNLQALVLDTSDTTVTVDIDTLNFNSFIYPPSGTIQIPAMAVPSSSGVPPLQFIPGTTLEAAFDNRPTT